MNTDRHGMRRLLSLTQRRSCLRANSPSPASHPVTTSERASTARESLLFKIVLSPFRAIENTHGWRRLGVLIAYALIALAIGAFLWRQTRIASLPDVGEPFDTAAYRAAARIPDDRNAFVPYWLAALMYREMSKAEADSFSNANFEWSRSDATFRGWVTEQDAAIALLLEGSARPEASLEMQVGMAETRVGMESNVLTARTSWIATAALFKADRLRVEGDPASAWALLLAAVRAGRHVERAEPTQGGRTQGMMFAQYARASGRSLGQRSSGFGEAPAAGA